MMWIETLDEHWSAIWLFSFFGILYYLGPEINGDSMLAGLLVGPSWGLAGFMAVFIS